MVRIGDVLLGGDHPVVVQSMTTTDTLDIDGTVEQSLALARAGSQLVRITAPTVKAAEALGEIRRRLRGAGCDVPLVADIHFHPGAAMEAVKHVEKVRVNPGNYADSRKFAVREYDDATYDAEMRRAQERFRALVKEAKARGVALRIGTNHGSLSDRIMNRYGDTALGMVESALEFLRVCAEEDHHHVVLSMKASNPQVMIQAYRLLAHHMEKEGFDHPFHLGVTEAGEGEDARIKSAIGIGSLLRDGIGDTVRVSLTESPTAEIPVARRLVELTEVVDRSSPPSDRDHTPSFDPFEYARRESDAIPWGVHRMGGDAPVLALVSLQPGFLARPDALERLRRAATPTAPGLPALEGVLVPAEDAEYADGLRRGVPGLAVVADEPAGGPIEERAGGGAAVSLRSNEPLTAYRRLLAAPEFAGDRRPVILHADLPADLDDARLVAASTLGALLTDGIGDAIRLGGPHEPEELLHLGLGVLQGARLRSSRTEYIACPGCGRTLFDLETTTQRIKSRTGHLPGVKIAVMGCIVNGPGEMADADFGYVGSSPGLVNLYVGKEIVRRNVPESDADEALIDLLREHDVWLPPDAAVATS